MIWTSPSDITLAMWVRVRVRITGDAHITRVMGMPKTRGCSYHCDSREGQKGGGLSISVHGKMQPGDREVLGEMSKAIS